MKNNNVLIAFDEFESARNITSFVLDHLTRDHQITLFHVVPSTAAACGLNSPSLTPYFESERNAFCRMEERREAMMVEMLETAKTRFVDAGFDKARVNVLVKSQKKGVAADIIREATDEQYDLVVMGRRSSSGIKEFFTGSTVQGVIHNLTGIPLVITA